MKTINTIKTSALTRNHMARLIGAYTRMGGVLTQEACKELWSSAKKLTNKVENTEVYVTEEQDLEIRMGLARDNGEVEPVLYAGDTLAYVPETEEEKEARIALNQVIDLQERMAKGYQIIQKNKAAISQISEDIQALWNDKPWMTKLFCSWKKVVLGETKYDGWITTDVANRLVNDKRNVQYIRMFTARHTMYENHKKLWAHWMKLNNTCKEVIGENKKVWPAYFQLVNEELNTYMISSGDYVEKIDNSTIMPDLKAEQSANGIVIRTWDCTEQVILDDEAYTHINENKGELAWNLPTNHLMVDKKIPSREAVEAFLSTQSRDEEAEYMQALMAHVDQYLNG